MAEELTRPRALGSIQVVEVNMQAFRFTYFTYAGWPYRGRGAERTCVLVSDEI